MEIEIKYFFSSILTLFLLQKFLIKKKLFNEKIFGKSHKIFLHQNEKLFLGGIFLLVTTFLNYEDYLFFIPYILIFLLGLASDLNLLNSPKYRIFLQTIILIIFLVLSDTLVDYTKIELIDQILKYESFKIIFTIFCFLVLMNGCNFIDGVNLSLIGYFLIVSVCLVYLQLKPEIVFNYSNLKILLTCFIVLFIFNFFSRIIMGDSGSYLVGLIFGYLGIMLSNENLDISPIYILNLFWYPAFENLFSIIRKSISKINISKPDNLHLHHYLYLYLKKKKISKYNNSLTGICINFYNLIVLVLATFFHNHSIILSCILILNIFIYINSYALLKNKV